MERAGGWYKRTTKRILFLLGCLMAVGFNADTINIFTSLQSNPQNMQQVLGMVNSFLGEPAVTALQPGAYPPPSQVQPYNPQAAVPSAGLEPYQPQPASPGNPSSGFTPYQQQAAPPSTPSGQMSGDLQPYQPPGSGAAAGVYGISLTELDQGNNRDYLQRMVLQELRNANSPFGIGWSGFQPQQLTTDGWIMKLLGWFITAMAISFGSPFWFDVLRKVANVSSSGSVN